LLSSRPAAPTCPDVCCRTHPFDSVQFVVAEEFQHGRFKNVKVTRGQCRDVAVVVEVEATVTDTEKETERVIETVQENPNMEKHDSEEHE